MAEVTEKPKTDAKPKKKAAPKTDLMRDAEKRAAEAMAEPSEWELEHRKGMVLILSPYPNYDLVLKPLQQVQHSNEKKQVVKIDTQKRVKMVCKNHVAYVPIEYLEELVRAPFYGTNHIPAIELKAALENRVKKKGFTLEMTAKGAQSFIAELIRRNEIVTRVALSNFTVIKELMRLPEDPELLKKIQDMKQSNYERQRSGQSIVFSK